MYYAHKLSTLYGLDQLVIAISIYFLIQVWFSGNYLIQGLTFVLLAGSTLLLINILHNNYVDTQLRMYGKNANAIVTSVKYMSGPKSYPGIIIKFTYSSNGKIYNHHIIDDVEDSKRIIVGDIFPIRYSYKDPDLFEDARK